MGIWCRSRNRLRLVSLPLWDDWKGWKKLMHVEAAVAAPFLKRVVIKWKEDAELDAKTPRNLHLQPSFLKDVEERARAKL